MCMHEQFTQTTSDCNYYARSDYDYTYDSARSSDCIEQSEPTMPHCFSNQIECGYDNDLSVSDLPESPTTNIRTTSPDYLLRPSSTSQ